MILLKGIYYEKKLVTEFKIKELGKLKYFLGIDVAHSEKKIFIS
jgi:hypothetical protein